MTAKVSRIKQDPLLATKPRVQVVELPVGGKVYIRKMSLGEREDAAKFSKQHKDEDSAIMRYLIVTCVCNAAGDPLYSDEQLDEMRDIDSDVADAVCNAILEFNGLSPKAQDDAKKN